LENGSLLDKVQELLTPIKPEYKFLLLNNFNTFLRRILVLEVQIMGEGTFERSYDAVCNTWVGDNDCDSEKLKAIDEAIKFINNY